MPKEARVAVVDLMGQAAVRAAGEEPPAAIADLTGRHAVWAAGQTEPRPAEDEWVCPLGVCYP